MNKTALFTLLALACTSAHAHRVWVSTNHTHGGDILKTELGYGEFPHAEPIVADRLHIFSKPMQLISGKNRQNLVQKGEHNYQYQSAKPVAEGTGKSLDSTQDMQDGTMNLSRRKQIN